MAVSKGILAGLQCDPPHAYRRLHHQIVRILAVRRVTRRNQHHACDVASMRIHDAARRAHLCFNVLFLHGSPRRQQGSQFGIGGLPPYLFFPGGHRRKQQEQECRIHSSHHGFGFLRDSSGTMPRWIAAVAACVRSVTPSLPSRLLMCVFTVASETPSSSAISLLLLPDTICSSTSISRGVSSSTPMRSASFSAMACGMCDLPVCTTRMAAINSSVVMPFSRYALAPAFSARYISSS